MGLEGKKQTHLKPQDASAVDPSKLTALTPEVVSGDGPGRKPNPPGSVESFGQLPIRELPALVDLYRWF